MMHSTHPAWNKAPTRAIDRAHRIHLVPNVVIRPLLLAGCFILVCGHATLSADVGRGWTWAAPRFWTCQALSNAVFTLAYARSNLALGRTDAALGVLTNLLQDESAMPQHRAEAAVLLSRVRPIGAEPLPGVDVPGLSKQRISPLRLFVGPDGAHENPGTEMRPFGSIHEAIAAVRRLRAVNGWPAGGVMIYVKPGVYRLAEPVVLTESDSGTALGPLTISGMAGTKPVFSGAKPVTGFRPVRDEPAAARLPPAARQHVWVADLAESGITNFIPLVLGGAGSGRGFITHPVHELIWDGVPLPMARWPNSGFAQITGVNLLKPITSHGLVGSSDGAIVFKHARIRQWAMEAEALLHGYWFWDWCDSYEKIQGIDITNAIIRLEPPVHHYGFRPGQPFRAVHMLCELDEPGEWYLDRATGKLYVWPPSHPQNARVELSVHPGPLFKLLGARFVRLERLQLEGAAGDAIHIFGGAGCTVAGCTIRNCGGDGLAIRGGSNHMVLSCDLYNLGRGGVVLEGGDRRKLTPGAHAVINCHVHHVSRLERTYTPAVLVKGVGHRLAHNLFHDIPSSAMRVDGNDHIIEFNEVFNVVTESDDQGAVDMWGDPTYRGVVFRYNYFHHIGGWRQPRRHPRIGSAGIRLDDAISGVLIYGNVFYKASAGRSGFGAVQIHGGRDNIVDNNLFVDCMAALSISPWPTNMWLDIVSNKWTRAELDKQLYLRRYPALHDLAENPNVNFFARNIAVNCGSFLLRDNQKQFMCLNWVGTNTSVIESPQPGLFTIREKAAPALATGFMPIPISGIGLYRDDYRTRLPFEILIRGRSQTH